MTREDILKLAQEAGWTVWNLDAMAEVMDGDAYHIQTDEVMRFAALVAAAERAACADICDQHASIEGIAQRCAAEIRARSKT